MRTLVESLRRLYKAGKTGGYKIRKMQEAGTITKEEAEYIIEG